MENLIYTAGLLDGEGSIMLSRNKPTEYRAPEVSITNTSQEIIEFLKQNFGGTVVKQKKYKEHHLDAWIWKVKHNSAIEFLKMISPYLKHVDKIYRADMILNEYISLTKRNGKYSDDESLAKIDFENRFLNKRL